MIKEDNKRTTFKQVLMQLLASATGFNYVQKETLKTKG